MNTEAIRFPERFSVKRLLGRGAMGSVYLAEDHELRNTEVALKLLHPWRQTDLSAERFRNEMLITRTLRHEHVVQTFELLENEGMTQIIVMEYVSGLSLDQLLRRGGGKGLPLFHAVRILAEVARAVAFAHSQSIIHRDLKPHNVLITTDGTVKISDFGVARFLEKESGMTHEGQAIGTPAYMSPEQFSGLACGPESDIYSFGILAYEVLTGVRPFADEVYLTLALHHLHSPIKWPIETEIPRWLKDIVQTATNKAPALRFRSMDEIVFELENGLAKLPEEPWEPVVARMRRRESYYRLRSICIRGGKVFKAVLKVYAVSLLITIGLMHSTEFLRNSLRAAAIWVALRTHSPVLQPFFYITKTRYVPLNRPRLVLDYWGQTQGSYLLDAPDNNPDIQLLIRAGADTSGRSHDGRALIHIFSEFTPSLNEELLASGADPNQRDPAGKTALQLMIERRADPSHFRVLAQTDFSCQDEEGNNVIHTTVMKGNPAVLKFLLSMKTPIPLAVVNAKNKRGETPLALALSNPDPEQRAALEGILLHAGGSAADPP